MKKKKEQFKESSMPTDVRFDYMMQGLSFDQAQDEYDSQKEQVQDYKEPTQKDILQDWIISKDYEQEQQELSGGFKNGGKKFQNGDYIEVEQPNWWQPMSFNITPKDWEYEKLNYERPDLNPKQGRNALLDDGKLFDQLYNGFYKPNWIDPKLHEQTSVNYYPQQEYLPELNSIKPINNSQQLKGQNYVVANSMDFFTPDDVIDNVYEPETDSLVDKVVSQRKKEASEKFLDNAAKGAQVLVGAAQLGADWYNRAKVNVDEKEKEHQSYLDSMMFNPNFMSTNQAFNQINSMPTVNSNYNAYDFGKVTTGQGVGNALSGALQGASAGSAFGVPGAIIGGAVGLIGSGITDWIGNRRADKALSNYQRGLNIVNNQNDAKIGYQTTAMNQWNKLRDMRDYTAKYGGKIHTKASGGYINSNSSNFPDKLTEFNVGGNHEDNPNGGIQQGINPNDGQPNLVEQDETKYNDYIFSKRIYADEGSLKANMLDKKYDNWVYADISKDLYKNYKERPNDAISRRTFEDAMQKLQNAQEATKLKLKQKKVGGFLNALDNEQISALTDQMMIEQEQRAQMEEQAEQERQAAIEQDNAEYQQELYNQAAQEGVAGQEAMLGQEYSKGGHVYQTKGYMDTPAVDNTYYNRSIVNPIMQEQFAQALENARQEAAAQGIPFVRPNYSGEKNTYGEPITYDVYYPDGTVGTTGMYTGIAPLPSSKTKIVSGAQKGMQTASKVKQSYNSAKAAYNTKKINDVKRTVDAEKAIARQMALNGEDAMKSRSLPQGLVYSRPEPVAFDYRYGADPVLNQGPDFFGTAAKWIQNAKAREAGLIGGILGGAGVLGTAAALLGEHNQDTSGQDSNNTYYTSGAKDALQGYGPLFDIEGSHGRVFDAGIDNDVINVFPWPQSYYPEDLGSDEPIKTNERYSKWKTNTKGKNNGSKGETPVTNQTNNTEDNTPRTGGGSSPNGTIGNKTPNGLTSPNVLIKPGGGSSLFTTYGKFGTGKPNSTTEEKPETTTETTGESNTGNTNGNNGNGNGNIDYNTLLRFASVIGSGINYVRDKLGLQNYNDYTDADMYQRQIDDIAPVYAPLIGGYQEYTPIDQEYLRNQTNAQAAAQMRAIANASNGNRGYVSVNNAVNRYDLLNNIGALGIAAAQQDMKDRLAVAEFNNKIDQINQSADLNVAEKNQAIQAEKAQLYSKLAEMRTAERYANDAARAGNENAFFANLGAIGKEATALKLANSNLGMYYGIDPLTMDLYYKPAFYRLSKDKKKEVMDSAEKMGIKVE